MCNKKILKLFADMAGMSTEEAIVESPLLSATENEIYSRLRQGININDYCDALAYAVAAETYYRYAIIQAGKTLSGSYQFGNVHIQQDAADLVAAASSVRSLFMSKVASILEDDNDFIFKKVQDYVNKK